MTSDSQTEENRYNKYCKIQNLRNESDVEQNFLIPLLDELGFNEDYRESKSTVVKEKIDKGKRRKDYRPDFICYADKAHLRPVLVIDAKHPSKSAEEGVDDAQLYTSVIRRRLDEPKPVQYCIGSNGLKTIVKHYDQDIEEYNLFFIDFKDGNTKFESLKTDMNRTVLAKSLEIISQLFEFKMPDTNEIRGIFEACHKIIWQREFESPVPAFWEFCKLMFIKLNEDKKLRDDPKIRKLIELGKPLPRKRVIFSTYYIAIHEHGDPNPIASLFKKFRDNFEIQILRGEKKRIFDSKEEIDLSPITIKQIVALLEHYDLIKIDEDLNGRLFQTFLSATMRGKELGQFFTPRTITEFMSDLAEIKITDKPPYGPYIADICCGTGGFLIEAMAKMTNQLKEGPLSKILAPNELAKIEKKLKDDYLFGIDAGKDPPIARIARINMYLHGDGGSRIWSTDALDKKVRVEETLDPELRAEKEELQRILIKDKMLFDICLTNPPFSMVKRASEPDQRKILQDYEIRKYIDKNGKTKVKNALKSNVMFLERYYDILKNNGILITVIDESVLNTDSNKPFRDWMFMNYYIKAVISLPRSAFLETGSSVKTSILFLVKKAEPTIDQPYTFYARSENIGYDKRLQDLSKNDLTNILTTYNKFKKTGTVPQGNKKDWSSKSSFFVKTISNRSRRINFEWLDPRHEEMDKRLKKIRKKKGYGVDTIGDLVSRDICKIIKGKTAKRYMNVSQGIPIIKVRNVTNEGINWNTDHILRSFFDENQKSHLRKNDVLIASTGVGSIGRVSIMDKDLECMTDGHISTIRILDKNKISPNYLVHYLRSVFGQMQIERYTVGCTGQTELNDCDINLIRIIYPFENVTDQDKIIKKAINHEVKALNSRKAYIYNLKKAKEEFIKALIS